MKGGDSCGGWKKREERWPPMNGQDAFSASRDMNQPLACAPQPGYRFVQRTSLHARMICNAAVICEV